jgi:hypothetical protein
MFEIEKPDGTLVSYLVDEETRYQGQAASLDDLVVGWHAAVAAKTDQDGRLVAVLLIAGTLPERVKAQGLIVGVDIGAGKFRLEKPDGTVLTFSVDEQTIFRGPVGDLSELELGARVGVVALKGNDGSLVARQVLAGKPRPEGPTPEIPLLEDEPPLEVRPFETL